VQYCDVSDPSTFPRDGDGYDTVVCLNVVEHVERDVEALVNIRSALVEGGRAVILVPQGQWNFGSLDEVLGHFRRYSRESLATAARKAGFEIEQILEFNRIGSMAWFLNGRLMRRRTFGLIQIKILNLLTPFMRAVDRIAPLQPLSLIAILKRPAGPVAASERVAAMAASDA
jgi:hypothetical protein